MLIPQNSRLISSLYIDSLQIGYRPGFRALLSSLPASFSMSYSASPLAKLLLLLLSPSPTLFECRSNQRIRPKTDSCVPKYGVPLTPSNRVRGWAQWPWKISGPLRAHPTDLLGCLLQHQLALQPAADIPERYEKSSLDPPHTICKQGQPLVGDDSHMSGGPDDAHIAGEQDALVPVDAGLRHLDSQVVGRGTRPGTACGYRQCRVLHSLQHLHVRLNQVRLAYVRTGRTNCIRPSKTLECPNDVADKTFITFIRDLALALISCVCWRKVQPRSIVTPSMFLSLFTGMVWPINVIVGLYLYSVLCGVTTVREDFEPSADIRLVVSHSSNRLR